MKLKFDSVEHQPRSTMKTVVYSDKIAANSTRLGFAKSKFFLVDKGWPDGYYTDSSRTSWTLSQVHLIKKVIELEICILEVVNGDY